MSEVLEKRFMMLLSLKVLDSQLNKRTSGLVVE